LKIHEKKETKVTGESFVNASDGAKHQNTFKCSFRVNRFFWPQRKTDVFRT